jgi:hypothetical protein
MTSERWKYVSVVAEAAFHNLRWWTFLPLMQAIFYLQLKLSDFGAEAV